MRVPCDFAWLSPFLLSIKVARRRSLRKYYCDGTTIPGEENGNYSVNVKTVNSNPQENREETARDTIRRALEANGLPVYSGREWVMSESRWTSPHHNHQIDQITRESKVEFKIISLYRSA